MHFACPGLPQQPDDPGRGGSSHDRVINHNHPLPFHRTGNRIQLDPYSVFPSFLIGGNEGSAHILVFDESDFIGNSGLFGISDGRIQPGIGHTDHNVRIHRGILGQEFSGPYPCLVDRDTVDHRIRTGKINIFKNTKAFLRPIAMAPDRADALLAENNDFTGLHIPDKGCAHRIQCTALRRNHIGSVAFSSEA